MADHEVREEPLTERLRVEIDGEIIADSTDVIRVDEDHNPARYYFPRQDVEMDALQKSPTETKCPFKGTATHFTLNLGGTLDDAAWSYEDPYEEHHALKDRIAFYTDEKPELVLRSEERE